MLSDKLSMMNLSLTEILRYVHECQNIIKIQEKVIFEFLNVLITAKNNERRIFVGGAGRSGFVGKFFAMRLMHMGFEVYVFDETIVKAIKNDDVLIIISKTGGDKSLPKIFWDSSVYNIKLLSLCGSKDCFLYKRSDASIVITELTDKKYSEDEIKQLEISNFDKDDLLVMGTAFEISSLVILESLITELMYNLKISSKYMEKNHDNLVKGATIKEGYEDIFDLKKKSMMKEKILK